MLHRVSLCNALTGAVWTVLIAATGLMCTTGTASSQTIPEQILRDQQQIQIREQEQRRLEQRRYLERPQQTTGSSVEQLQLAPRLDAACFDIQEIVVVGDLTVPTGQVTSKLESLAGQCLTPVDLRNILRAVTNYYVGKGYITTRAYLKPQDISQGRFEVLVIEGNVDGVTHLLNDEPRHNTEQIFGKRKGQILNLRDFEQGLDQINRLGSKQAKIRIEPGQHVGTSHVFIDVRDTYSVDASASLSNEGSQSTGRHQLSSSFTMEDTLGYYESVTLTAKTSLDELENDVFSRSVNGYVSVPWRYTLFSLSGSYQEYQSELSSPSRVFHYNGSSWEARAAMEQTVFRNKNWIWKTGTGLTLKENANYIEDLYIDASSQRLAIAELFGSLSGRVLSGAANARVTFKQGLNAFAAQQDPNIIGQAPSAQFSEVELEATWRRGWATRFGAVSFATNGFVSASNHTLFSSERVSLGSSSTVRGFRDDSLSGDVGGYLRTEVSWQPSLDGVLSDFSAVIGQPQVFAAVDAGRIANDGADPNEGGSMAGAAVGLRFGGGALSGQIVYERPLHHPQFISVNQRGFIRAQVRLRAQF
ncbi:hypothetical protein A3843_00150 [Pseudovibrio exalbescens]|uniref:POTRA domain-containing protein n=1 Tax=Pseudovibrio exalbescens TaxID=197461 RepID=A0A1U7JDP0_9HYPH|nr:hypothetical protein A3843_00150 [Pseudovibrio exalbescens]